MKILASIILTSAALLALPVRAEDAPNPVAAFLRAADNNDFSIMRTLLPEKIPQESGGEISQDDFIHKIESCYLRRVYSTPEQGRLIAAWMCAEGKGKSRVVNADVWQSGGLVQVNLYRESRNDRPAPARNGSAFAESPK